MSITTTLTPEALAVARHAIVREMVYDIARLALVLDAEGIAAWQRALRHADTAGPIFQTSAWIARRDELEAARNLAAAFAAFHRAAQAFKAVREKPR